MENNSLNKSFCFKYAILLVGILSFAFPALSTNVNIWPKEIKFNYDSGSSTYDAITLKSNATTYINVPEWEYNGGTPTSEGFAYIINQNSRKIQVCFDSNCSNEMLLFITLTVTSGTGIGTLCNYFVCNYTKLDWVTITLDGSIPGSINIWDFTWQWSIYAIPVGGTLCAATSTYSTSHYYYTLLAAPQAPMEVPWTSVLDSACSWASGETNYSNVIQKITEGIYYINDAGGDIDYDYDSYYCSDFNKIDLSRLLTDLRSKTDVQVNCTDCGNFVSVLMAAIGCQAYTKRIWSGINTNEIDPIGSVHNWETVSWKYHQYGWTFDLVYDACLRLDRYGTPRVPTNMTQSIYNSLLINGSPPSNFQIYTTEIVP